MKRYTVVLTQTAEKELYRLPSRMIEKIVLVLKSLEENPRPSGCKKLKGKILTINYKPAAQNPCFLANDRIKPGSSNAPYNH